MAAERKAAKERHLKFLILHGPNLNLLGEREPEVYGSMTLAELNRKVAAHARKLGCRVRAAQSNHEGKLIDLLHASRGKIDGVIFNPGAYTHYSYALRDAVAAIRLPVVEVHLSGIHAREEFRKVSVIAPVCVAQVSGLGWQSYARGLELLLERFEGRNHGG